ncbi:MAG: hypothetical protein BWY49_01131 [Candidatus Omnitrophica bacterium ADurb.Bin314]|jgi:hypothetical protein|nr:MAG: hypothetical protein BWY49_01131 [Candidatus Omnitrophica bacterium ADurb.Bin314]
MVIKADRGAETFPSGEVCAKGEMVRYKRFSGDNE